VPNRPLIQLTDVVAGHGAKTVLTGVNWAVRRGQAWYVVGRNGAGKSTLLATALGRCPALAGQVQRHSGLVAGSVPQQCGLVSELPVTIAEFVGLGLVDVPSTRRAERVADALMMCGLTSLARCQVWRVSSGERRRAMIARALVLRPNLLALDEPNAGLDAIAERELLALLIRLRGVDVTVICITHDWSVAAAQASHVAVIADGTLREVAPRDLLAPPIVGPSSGAGIP
jgi:ABC-type Mn2+/Zn2+ transport system ATPase subunit